MGVTSNMGGEVLLNYALGADSPVAPLVLLLSASTVTLTPGAGPNPLPPFETVDGYAEVIVPPTDWFVGSDSTGTTATLSSQSITLGSGSDSAYLLQWVLIDSASGYWYWGGPLDPPFLYPGYGPVTCVASGITITYGQCATSSPADGLVAYDTFAGSGSVALGSHSPNLGGPWTVSEGALVVVGGSCSATTTGTSVGTIPCGTDTVTVTLDLTYGSGDLAGVNTSYQDSANMTVLYVTGTTLVIGQVVAGSYSTVASTTAVLTPGQTYRLTVSQSGAAVSLTLTGLAAIVSIAVATFSAPLKVAFFLGQTGVTPTTSVQYLRVLTP